MFRHSMLAAAPLFAIVFMLATSTAVACPFPQADIFAEAERAHSVVVATGEGDKMHIKKTLRGPHQDSSSVDDTLHLHRRIRDGSPGIVAFDETSDVVASHLLPDSEQERAPVVDLLTNYLAIDDDAQRRDLLADAAVGGDRHAARVAARHLADRPEWFDDIADEHLDNLRNALRAEPDALRRGDSLNSPLFWLALRLADDATDGVLRDLFTGSLERYRIGLGYHFLNHHYRSGSYDREELARVIEEDPQDRVAALERCERDIGTSLFPSNIYRSYLGSDLPVWSDLADACRRGEPLPHPEPDDLTEEYRIGLF